MIPLRWLSGLSLPFSEPPQCRSWCWLVRSVIALSLSFSLCLACFSYWSMWLSLSELGEMIFGIYLGAILTDHTIRVLHVYAYFGENDQYRASNRPKCAPLFHFSECITQIHDHACNKRSLDTLWRWLAFPNFLYLGELKCCLYKALR